MKNLTEQMKMDLEFRGLSLNTQDAYLGYIKRIGEHFGKSPEKLSDDQIKEHLHYLLTVKKSSRASVNVAYSALRFFYETTCGREWNTNKILRTKYVKRLPIALTKGEIKALLESVTNIKHKAIFMTTYAAGLRVGETAHLKICDVDSINMQLKISQGKGQKDRYSLLSEKNLTLLRSYWKEYRPKTWLFPGISSDKPISTAAVQCAFNSAKKRAGINKPATVHSLRHSFATHLLNDGVSIYHIQQLLGHASMHTTCIYLHLQRQDLAKIVSPLDFLEDPEND